MNIEQVREHCIGKAGVTEDFPFGDDVLVFKVGGKMFALINIERDPLSVNLKCDPDRAIELRDRWDEVQPGYHMNKKHWNTVLIEGRIPDEDFLALIDDSYALVFASLTRRARAEIESPSH